MRNALNNNPVVRAVVLGIMALLVAFLLFTRVLGGGSEEAAPPADSGAAATEAGATATPGASAPATGTAPAPTATAPAPDPAAAGATAPPATGSTPLPAAPSDVASAFIPGPGLPEEVVVAYARNKAVALLVLRRRNPDRRPVSDRSPDDRALRLTSAPAEFLGRLSGRVKFITTSAKNAHKYARITEGVDLNRVPALIVIRPRKLTNNTPEAIIEYGFRGPGSVAQVIKDAFFDGKSVTYDP